MQNITTVLPDALISHVLEWLWFGDRRRYFSCNHALWRARSAYQATLQHLVLVRPPPPSCLQTVRNLHSLEVEKWANDDFLRNLSDERVMPNLKHLSMIKSLQVTDTGLELLTRNPVRCKNLETIDITYCRRTTYAGTFVLRDKLKALRLLRRQPEWMDGVYETPFQNDNLHTYWADGTFSFDRDSLARGYVCDLFQWGENENHVGTKLKFNDEESLEGLPLWAKNLYRPGVSVLRLPGEHAVLVAQRVHGIYPPKECPRLEHKNSVPLGQTVYLDRDGNVLEGGNRAESSPFTMISHIPMRPLATLVPPNEIVEKNRAAAELRGMYSLDEVRLHILLGGYMDDFGAISVGHMYE